MEVKDNDLDLLDIIKGTAIMLAFSDNEEWAKLSQNLKLQYLQKAIVGMLKGEFPR